MPPVYYKEENALVCSLANCGSWVETGIVFSQALNDFAVLNKNGPVGAAVLDVGFLYGS